MRPTVATCLTLAAAAAMLSIAMPSRAATPVRAEAIRTQIAALEQDINRTDRRDNISEREAAGLRNQLDELQDLFRRYNSNGLSVGEMNALEDRIRRLRARLGNERRDPGRRRG